MRYFLHVKGSIKALGMFMSTDQGRAFVAKYENVIQIIMGYKFESTGENTQRGIDLRLRTISREVMGDRFGTAITYLKNNIIVQRQCA